jgi:hypothetical protein
MPGEQRQKNPVFVESGRRAARARWGERRHLRLDKLTPMAAAIVRALIAADEASKKAAES